MTITPTWADEESARREHQPRERAVPCFQCHKDTWNFTAVCNDCLMAAGA